MAALMQSMQPAPVPAAAPAAKHGGMTFTPTVKLEGGRWVSLSFRRAN
jgi:hypothetical protein